MKACVNPSVQTQASMDCLEGVVINKRRYYARDVTCWLPQQVSIAESFTVTRVQFVAF